VEFVCDAIFVMIKTITKVLERENLKEYMPLFEGEGITDDILDTLTDKDLDDLGIKKLGERRRILLGFAEGISGQFDMNIMTTVAGGVLPEESEFKRKKVEAFRIGKYPVTQMEWDRVRLWGLAHGFKMESGEANDLAPKKRGGAFWLFGFMALGGFEVQRGFISKGRV
jgi:hypothetical protein